MPEEKWQQEEPIVRNPKNASLRGAKQQNNRSWESRDTPLWNAEEERRKLQTERRKRKRRQAEDRKTGSEEP